VRKFTYVEYSAPENRNPDLKQTVVQFSRVTCPGGTAMADSVRVLFTLSLSGMQIRIQKIEEALKIEHLPITSQ